MRKRVLNLISLILISATILCLQAAAFAEDNPEAQKENWVLVYMAYYYSGELSSETEMTYNASGSITECSTHIINQDGTETWEVESFTFDDNDRLTGSETLDKETGEILKYSIWRHNKDGRLQQILYYDADGSLQSEQNNRNIEDGSKIEVIQYDDNEEIRSHSVSWYDNNHRNYKYESYNEYGEPEYIRKDFFGSDGNKKSGYEKGYGSKSTLKYIYDDDGLLLECIKTQESGYSSGRVTRTIYSYDEHGNQTEEITLYNGEILSRYAKTWRLLEAEN